MYYVFRGWKKPVGTLLFFLNPKFLQPGNQNSMRACDDRGSKAGQPANQYFFTLYLFLFSTYMFSVRASGKHKIGF